MGTAALIAATDPVLLDDLLRLAAAADAGAEVARDPGQARAAWRHPPLVLFDVGSAAELAGDGVCRRSGVILVTNGRADEEVYRTAVDIGAQDVAVLPDAEARLVDALSAAAEPAGERALTVCVTGGRGGAGASTFAAVLALTGMFRGLRTLLVDGDPLGGGLDLVLGQERVPGARWPEFAGLHGRLSGSALRESLPGLAGTAGSEPADGGLTVLSWHRGQAAPIPAEAMRSVLDAGERGFELVVVDLPRHLDAAGAEALMAAGVTFLVVPAELRAVVAGHRVAAALARHTSEVRVVVRGPAPGGLTPDAIAHALGLPLAGAVSSDRRLATALEHGELPATFHRSPLADLCVELVTGLVPRPARRGGIR
jgi:secretion/DNA translocation related CpaE-like protein